MNADSTFIIGSTHAVCQDYALSHTGPSGSFVIVSDGCSTSPDTDLGARLLARAAAKIISTHQETDLKSIHETASNTALQWATTLGLPPQAVDATLLTAHCEGENLLVGVTGDGVLVLESQSGCIDVYSISFPSGFPLYPTYLYQPDRFDAWAIKADAVKEVKHFQAVSINEPVQLVGTSITTTLTEEFLLRAADYKHVVLMSDGIHSFYCAQETATSKSLKSISLDHQLRETISFRGKTGAFVARRVKKLSKEWTAKGWGHSDDLTIGAIYLGD